MPRSSADLLEKARGGDRAALEELLLLHLPGLRAFVRLRAGAIVRKREACSDLVQSVCREVLERAERFRHGGESAFRHWLYATALRKIVDKRDYHTAQRRDVRREDGALGAAPPPDGAVLTAYRAFSSPSLRLASAEEIERIEAAFDELPEDYREVILLARIVGLSRSEVAAEMGRTEASVRNLLHRALATLSQRLDATAE
jgi:RNA polymerase sigma-70 factor (ECF subfamily)